MKIIDAARGFALSVKGTKSAERSQTTHVLPVRRKPVAWFAPGQLAGTALRVMLAQRFGAYLDKRELQAMFPQSTFRHDSGELWLDYVADVGDGFDATYSIAYLLSQPSLNLGALSLPRGQVLVMGGDQVYPAGSSKEYRERCEGPYETAFPDTDEERERPPALYALPGNHDWYDGLTAFLRLFGKGRHFGGWRSPQSRSYFALRLPHGWWLYAIDVQFDAYLDGPQMDYFHEAAKELKPGDKVIIAAPRPTWVHTRENPSDYDTIKYFIKKVIGNREVHVRLHVSGDVHHYARYGDGFITCGGGGAYLAGTHGLPESISVPLTGAEEYPLCSTYPSGRDSRRYRWGVFWRMPLRNPTFALLLGFLHTLALLTFLTASSKVLTLPVMGIVGMTFGATLGFSTLEARSIRTKNWILGCLHGLAHMSLALTGTYLWSNLRFTQIDPPWSTLVTFLYLPVAAVFAVEIVAAYLLIADRYGVNSNELFAGQGIIDSKSFLRMHFGSDGSLTIYPIGLRRSGRSWVPGIRTEHGPISELVPDEPLIPHLIEPPFTLR